MWNHHSLPTNYHPNAHKLYVWQRYCDSQNYKLTVIEGRRKACKSCDAPATVARRWKNKLPSLGGNEHLCVNKCGLCC